MKNFNIEKENCRGAIKQIMKVAGVRKISLENYFNYLGVPNYTGVHSIKYDIQAGYVNLYAYAKVNSQDDNDEPRYRCGREIEDGTPEMYNDVHKLVIEIFKNSSDIKNEVRRNIIVTMNR